MRRLLPALLLLCVLAASAAATTEAGAVPGARTAAEARAAGWPDGARPPWIPLVDDVRDLLERATPLSVALDGDFGGPLRLLHLPGDAPVARFERDGLGLWLDHAWADDPWTVSLAGVDFDGYESVDGAPLLRFVTAPADTAGPRLDSAFYKGDRDTYLRRLSFRTPRAPWEFGLHFGESIDQLPDDRRSTTEHSSKRRSLRTTVRRRPDAERSLLVDFERVRKHKTYLPGLAENRQEHYGQRVALDWRAPGLRVAARAQDADVVRLTGTDERKLEVGREAVVVESAADGLRPALALHLDAWRLADSGAGVWADADSGAVRAAGEMVELLATRPWRRGRLVAAGRWRSDAGWSPRLGADLQAGPWRLGLETGGRAPRLDELHTADRYVGDRTWTVLPNHGLEWERHLRATGGWSGGFLGCRAELAAEWRRVENGVGWTALEPDGATGRLANDVELDGWSVDLALRRRFALAGLLRWEGRVTLRGVDLRVGEPLALPPERSAVLNLFWERHLFHEDGILELGYVLEHRGAGDDPWLPAGAPDLPARTLHHLLLEFRLLGAELGVELRNLTGATPAVSARSLEPPREKRWRLAWTLLH